MRHTLSAIALSLSLGATSAIAQEPLDGFFIARKACNATISIRNAASESGTVVNLDRAYRVIGENRVQGSHYYVVVPEAEPARRWIDKRCGDWVRVVARAEAFERPGGGSSDTGGTNTSIDDARIKDDTADAAGQDEPVIASSAGSSTAGGSGSGNGAPPRNFVLAISWQPAFCETHGRKAECRSQTGGRFDADHFTLHGLWPQPRGLEYCGVSAKEKSEDKASRWQALPPVDVDAATRTALAEVMPGTQSSLDRHEWTRHGTCYQASADEYFDDSLALVAAINASKVRDLFAGSIGGTLTRDQIRATFDEAFGGGAGERVRVSCTRDDGRNLIGELTIGLVGEITANPDVSALIAAARPTDGGCNEGIVDAVGFQ